MCIEPMMMRLRSVSVPIVPGRSACTNDSLAYVSDSGGDVSA